MKEETQTYQDVYPRKVEEDAAGEVQPGSWNVLVDSPDVEVE